VNNLIKLTEEGQLIQLISLEDNKSFLVFTNKEDKLETHKGIIHHSSIIGKPFGSIILSHLEKQFLILIPSTSNIIRTIKRKTQIIFPKDLGLILLRLSIKPGQQIIEAGTGSGALTATFAEAVGSYGKIFSYDKRSDTQQIAAENLKLLGLDKRVELKTRDISQGFDEKNIPAIFLDLNNPWDYLNQVLSSLENGGFFGSILPTYNQVSNLLKALDNTSFGMFEVVEVMLRNYKTTQNRLRPTDRMVAHTGYLIFARSLYQEQ
tara:strand:+ start:2725 stop:3516 length:792 start_codon:yes stop_codon:yes gene_type:complete